MPQRKRQHFVPQFILRRFAAVGESDRIWTLDKRTNETRLQAIRDCAHETRFYEHPDLSRAGISLEERLAAFEGAVAPCLARIVENRSLLSVGLEERFAVIDFALVQLFRTRAAREFAKQGSRVLLQEELSEELATQCSLAALLRDFSKYRSACANHILSLREIVSPDRLVLGDSMTLLMRTHEVKANTLSGILPTATICVPLSPSLTLMFFSGIREPELADAGPWYRPESRVLTEAQPGQLGDAQSMNAMSVIAANRFVYSSTSDFSDCQAVLTANPNAIYGPIGGWKQ